MTTAVRHNPFSKSRFNTSKSRRENIVVYGPNELALQLAGYSIADVLTCLTGRGGLLSIADEVVACVDGRMVNASYILQPGERLELFMVHGQKAAWEEADRILLERLVAAVEAVGDTIRGSHKHQEKNLRLSHLEELILRALGDQTLRAKEIATLCREDLSSHFRATLSQLVKRGVLLRNGDGYYVNRQVDVA
ncbi:MAG: hypothetical protein JNM18_12500 [Planctomycetaceae bacterium]|nr:hypothetical protein [Planctomycetaceae bacterium]